MFAKFSPQGDRVAYVRENNIYVERLSDGSITALTKDGSRTIINGTFDWVYEEEFDDRDGFRWSPDGTRIAYWQLDASGVRDFLLINDTDSLYSFTDPVQYPKAGTTNSAVRVGVVSASGGATRWMQLPGDPRNIYLARMEWAGNSTEVMMQHLNRLQNTLTILLRRREDRRRTTSLFVDQDSAWVEVVDDWELARRREALPLDQRARRLAACLDHLARRQGREADHAGRLRRRDVVVDGRRPADGSTSGPRPTIRPSATSTAPGWTARRPRSVSHRPTQTGTHSYRLAPGAKFAIHTYSSIRDPAGH